MDKVWPNDANLFHIVEIWEIISALDQIWNFLILALKKSVVHALRDSILYYLVTDRPEIGFLGTQNQLKNGFKASWTRLFFIFWQVFGTFDDFSKLCSAVGMLYFEKTWNMTKNWQKLKKSLIRLASLLYTRYQKSR